MENGGTHANTFIMKITIRARILFVHIIDVIMTKKHIYTGKYNELEVKLYLLNYNNGEER